MYCRIRIVQYSKIHLKCPDTYAMLLHGNIRQMNVHVVELLDAGVVLDSAKATKSQFKKVRLERLERRNKDIQSEIEFLAADQQWIVDISVEGEKHQPLVRYFHRHFIS